MAVDLGELIEDVKAEVAAPGEEETTFPNAGDDSWVTLLRNGFWSARLDGLLVGYEEADGLITPISGTTELSRELQQIIVFYAGMTAVRNHLRSLGTATRSRAGNVSFEVEHGATVLNALLQELMRKRNILLERLSDLGHIPSYYMDAIVARDEAFAYWLTPWPGNDESRGRYIGRYY